jgi:tRNA threonylcarbamoyl adenosine modification protein (Sua5/YciO/YrdC/YwlC family)
MLLKLYPENPNQKQILKIVEVLRNGGVIIFPTDTIYAIGCDINNTKAVDRVARIKGIKIEKADFSFICSDLSHLSDFARHISNPVFKMMKRNLPGPYTFILEASNRVPKIFKHNKKTIGIRVPDNSIPVEIVKELGNPLLSTSIHNDDESVLEYITDPELIHEKYESLVDLVIDGGFGHNLPSTVIDCTNDDMLIVRQGIGEVTW